MTLTDIGPVQQGRLLPPWWVAAITPGGGDGVLRVNGEPSSALPPVAESSGCRLLFDGVLYDRDELTSELGGALHNPSDADLVLRAYLHVGPRFLDRLRGTFALVVDDRRDGTVLCARDPLGNYPLFYTEAPGGDLLVSASIEALVAQPGIIGDVNRLALADHLSHRWPELEETYYEAVRRIGPGHLLMQDVHGRRRTERYWLPEPPASREDGSDSAELVERFEHLLDQAVNRGLDLGPTGIYLSGGIDSVAVAALATERSRERGLPEPRALSLAFEHPAADEGNIQRAVAAQLGLEQDLLLFSEAVGGGLVRNSMLACADRPAPLLGVWEPAYQKLGSIGRRHGCDVLLTGSGGDEWLTFSPVYAADLVRSFDVAALLRVWNVWRRSYQFSNREVTKILLWQYGVSHMLGAAAGHVLRTAAPGVITRRRRREVDRAARTWIAPDPTLREEMYVRHARSRGPEAPNAASLYAAQARRALDSPVMALELEELVERGRRVGSRLFHPFWDADLARFLYEIPPEVLIRGGRSKGLIRDSLSRRFPELGFERQRKVSGTEALHDVLLQEAVGVYREIGGARALAELDLVDPGGLDAHVAGLSTASTIHDTFPLWHVLSTEAWLRPRIGLKLAL